MSRLPAFCAASLFFAIVTAGAQERVPERVPLPQPKPQSKQLPAQPAQMPPPSQAAKPPSQADAPATLPNQPGANLPNASLPSDCQVRLKAFNIAFETGAVPAKSACTIADPVHLVSVPDEISKRTIRFPDKPLLSCEMAERFANYAATVVAPMAQGVYGQGLTDIATGPGFDCRPRNRVPGAKLSAHGAGLATDLARFKLSDGSSIAVERARDDRDQVFLKAIRAAACGFFSTVLGPGADASHANHMHVDLEPRGRSGETKLCQ